MMESTIFGAAVGILLGLHKFKVLILLPATLLVVSGAILYGRMDGQNFLTITFNSQCAAASLEAGYLLFVVEYLQGRVNNKNATILS
jgi:hypothetical protein